jgi:DNA-binding MarR family transcriptional regulator
MIRALYFDLENKWAEIGREFNLSPAQQHILFLLSTNDNKLTPTKIGELGCWHNSTVTRLLNRLEKNEFIYVVTKRNHLGFKVVSMTEKGKRMLEMLIEKVKISKQFPFDMRHLSEKEVNSFLQLGNSILDVEKGKEFRDNVINAQAEGCDYA